MIFGSCWCWFLFFFFLIYHPQKKQRTKELSQLFHSYNPYDHKVRHFIYLFIYSLNLEVNSQFTPLVLWILGMYFPNTMVTPPSSSDVKSSECSVSFASPQRAFTWHEKQPLQVTILSLWLWRVDRLLKTSPLVDSVVDEDSSHTLITACEWDRLNRVDTSPPPFV